MQYSQWKYTILLVAMFLMLGARLEISELPIGSVVTEACVTLMVLAGMSAVIRYRHSKVLTLSLGIPVVLLTIWSKIEPEATTHATFVLQRITLTLFLGFIMVTVLHDLLSQTEITRDSLVGAFCGYLLIGAIGTEVYSLIDLIDPTSFGMTGPSLQVNAATPEVRQNQLQYFSFVTLTTIGYGDILPGNHLTRVIACLEAICGQFYLAILVAGLVSIRVGQSSGKPMVSDVSADDELK